MCRCSGQANGKTRRITQLGLLSGETIKGTPRQVRNRDQGRDLCHGRFRSVRVGRWHTVQETRREVKTYENYIDGEWVAASSGETYETRDPGRTSEVVGRATRCLRRRTSTGP